MREDLKHPSNSAREKDFSERWEQNFTLLLLGLFILFGVLFFVFLIPKINPEFSLDHRKAAGPALLSEENDPVRNYAAGVKLSDERNYSQALSYFQKAAAEDPENAGYLGDLALTHYRLKNYDEAIKAYERLLTLDADNEGLYCNRLGNIYRDKKEYDRAESYYRRAIEKAPRLDISYNNLALMLDNLGRRAEAVAVLEAGIAESEDRQGLEDTLSILQGAH